MRVNHALGGWVGTVDSAVQRERLAGRITADLTPGAIDVCQPRRIQPAEARVGRRDEQPILLAVIGTQAHADVARGGVHIVALVQRAADSADLRAPDFLALFLLGPFMVRHESCANALPKKSGLPKLPDLSAR